MTTLKASRLATAELAFAHYHYGPGAGAADPGAWEYEPRRNAYVRPVTVVVHQGRIEPINKSLTLTLQFAPGSSDELTSIDAMDADGRKWGGLNAASLKDAIEGTDADAPDEDGPAPKMTGG